MYQKGWKIPRFFFCERLLQGRPYLFPSGGGRMIQRGVFHENQHFSINEEGGHRHGSFPYRKDQRLHGHVKPPSAGYVAESKGASLPYALPAGGMGLHHEGPCPYLQGWRGQYQRRHPGAGGQRVSHSGACPGCKRAAWLHRVHDFGAA